MYILMLYITLYPYQNGFSGGGGSKTHFFQNHDYGHVSLYNSGEADPFVGYFLLSLAIANYFAKLSSSPVKFSPI